MNLEGRVQRLRRAVLPPCPDELAWISKLAARFDVDVPAARRRRLRRGARPSCIRDLTLDDLGAHAPLPARHPYVAPVRRDDARRLPRTPAARCGSSATAPLFSGPAVERVPELELPASGARRRALGRRRRERAASRTATRSLVRSNGTSVELRARVNRKLVEGVVRVADEHAGDLHPVVEVVKT